MNMVSSRVRPILSGLCLVLILGGCEPLSLTILGVGASAGITHQMNGLAYNTFTAPLLRVKAATKLALKRMDIRLESEAKTDSGEILYARASDRWIEIEIERITPTATRIRALARREYFLMDSATAVEIIAQTRKAMELAGEPTS